jgi:acetolactate synthase-1/2/3 large subunit
MPNKLIRRLKMNKPTRIPAMNKPTRIPTINENSKKAQQVGAELVVRTLEMQGVTHIFGIPGAKIDSVFNALVDSKIETVVCRHEQNAAFIAGGIGRMTGKAGVAIATSGPGVSNLTTGLATANSEGDPVVALGGAVATSEALKQIHQTIDAVSILKPVTQVQCDSWGSGSSQRGAGQRLPGSRIR